MSEVPTEESVRRAIRIDSADVSLVRELARQRERADRLEAELESSVQRNETVAAALRETRRQLEKLKEGVEQLCAAPNAYGVVEAVLEDGTVRIVAEGRALRVTAHPELEVATLLPGQRVLLNENMNVIAADGFPERGEIASVSELLGDGRVVVLARGDDERVVTLAAPLRGLPLRAGDPVLIDPRSGFAIERMPKSSVEEVALEEVPDVRFDQVGGLADQIETLRDAIELPYTHPDVFREHRLSPPKGILLYGPPGCGKTLLAKAVAASLARSVEQRTGRATPAFFLNVKGPELLNKYVGETEHKLREVFRRARDMANDESPVVIFFDEMDSLFRMRGSGISSDMEATVVAQFLAEIDGVESLRNVVVIGATNRQDLIDPAVLRPGRLDLKVKVPRPDADAARQILSRYLTPDLPLHASALAESGGDPDRATAALVEATVCDLYASCDANRFLEVTYAAGEREVLYFKDFASGAMLENVVARAKKKAVKRLLTGGERGIRLEDLLAAAREEFKENEDLPNTTNPDDWARISGRKGERIVQVRTVMADTPGRDRPVETLRSGQYL